MARIPIGFKKLKKDCYSYLGKEIMKTEKGFEVFENGKLKAVATSRLAAKFAVEELIRLKKQAI